MSGILKHITVLREETFQSGDVLLKRGDEGSQLLFLVEGSVSVEKDSIQVARISEPGALFGEMSVLLDLPISADVIALDEVRVRICDEPVSFLKTTPEVALHAARILASRLQSTTTYLADIKSQYQDQTNHLGLVDKVLDALTEQQPRAMRNTDRAQDPRL